MEDTILEYVHNLQDTDAQEFVKRWATNALVLLYECSGMHVDYRQRLSSVEPSVDNDVIFHAIEHIETTRRPDRLMEGLFHAWAFQELIFQCYDEIKHKKNNEYNG